MHRHPTRRHWTYIESTNLSEFVFTDGQDQWDNPSSAANYEISSPGRYAVYHGRLIQLEPNDNPILLIADLDNTLIGSHSDTRSALSRFTDYWLKHHYFSTSKLVYSTGRSLEEYLSIYDQGHELLDPDMVVTAVGSDAYTMDALTGKYTLHEKFYELYDSTHWDSHIVDQLVKEHFTWFVQPSSQHIFSFKIWGKARTEDLLTHREALKTFLKNGENKEYSGVIIKAKIIVSGEGDWRYIDITPPEGGKNMGLRYAQRMFSFEDARTLVAGDSGNDIDMFRGANPGVVVGNRQDELETWFKKKPRKNKYISELFWADAVIEALQRLK